MSTSHDKNFTTRETGTGRREAETGTRDMGSGNREDVRGIKGKYIEGTRTNLQMYKETNRI